jgi:hypothetical protein
MVVQGTGEPKIWWCMGQVSQKELKYGGAGDRSKLKYGGAGDRSKEQGQLFQWLAVLFWFLVFSPLILRLNLKRLVVIKVPYRTS